MWLMPTVVTEPQTLVSITQTMVIVASTMVGATEKIRNSKSNSFNLEFRISDSLHHRFRPLRFGSPSSEQGFANLRLVVFGAPARSRQV